MVNTPFKGASFKQYTLERYILSMSTTAHYLPLQENEYPWMVALKTSGNSSKPMCGAALISSRWLTTAAHCLTSGPVLDIAILGEHDVTTDTESIITIVSSFFRQALERILLLLLLINDL